MKYVRLAHRWNPSNQNVAAAAARSDTAIQMFDLEYTQARSPPTQRRCPLGAPVAAWLVAGVEPLQDKCCHQTALRVPSSVLRSTLIVDSLIFTFWRMACAQSSATRLTVSLTP